MKTIKTDTHLLLVDETAEINEDNYVYHPEVAKEYTIVNTLKEGNDRYSKGEHITQGVYKHKPTTNPFYKKESKIIASYPPLEGCYEFETLPPNTEDDVEKLAEKYVTEGKDFKAEGFSEYQNGKLNGFIDGYNQAKSETRFSLEDLVTNFKPKFDKFINDGGANGSSEDWIQWQNVVEWFPKFLQSLTKKEYEFVPKMEIIKEGYEKGKVNHSYQPKIIKNKIQGTWKQI